jgi:hypothetical protein
MLVGVPTYRSGACIDNVFTNVKGVASTLAYEVELDYKLVEFITYRNLAGKNSISSRLRVPVKRRDYYISIAW